MVKTSLKWLTKLKIITNSKTVRRSKNNLIGNKVYSINIKWITYVLEA